MIASEYLHRSAGRLIGVPDEARLAGDQLSVFAQLRSVADLRGACVLEVGGCLPPSAVVRSGVDRWWSCDPRFVPVTDSPVECLEAPAENIPLAANAVDIVFSCNALQHVADPARVFAEIARVLKPGGLFYANFGPVWSGPDGAHIEGLEHGGKVLNFWDGCWLPPWLHLVCDDLEELREALTPLHGVSLAEVLADYVYNSDWINRVSADSFRCLAAGSDFEVVFFGGNGKFDYPYEPPPYSSRLSARTDPANLLQEIRRRDPSVTADFETRDIEFLLMRSSTQCTS